MQVETFCADCLLTIPAKSQEVCGRIRGMYKLCCTEIEEAPHKHEECFKPLARPDNTIRYGRIKIALRCELYIIQRPIYKTNTFVSSLCVEMLSYRGTSDTATLMGNDWFKLLTNGYDCCKWVPVGPNGY